MSIQMKGKRIIGVVTTNKVDGPSTASTLISGTSDSVGLYESGKTGYYLSSISISSLFDSGLEITGISSVTSINNDFSFYQVGGDTIYIYVTKANTAYIKFPITVSAMVSNTLSLKKVTKMKVPVSPNVTFNYILSGVSGEIGKGDTESFGYPISVLIRNISTASGYTIEEILNVTSIHSDFKFWSVTGDILSVYVANPKTSYKVGLNITARVSDSSSKQVVNCYCDIDYCKVTVSSGHGTITGLSDIALTDNTAAGDDTYTIIDKLYIPKRMINKNSDGSLSMVPITSIQQKAFKDYYPSSISIPSSITYIGNNAFNNTIKEVFSQGGIDYLTSRRDDGSTNVDYWVLDGKESTDLIFKPSNNVVGIAAFSVASNTNITSIDLYNTKIKYINTCAFTGCINASAIYLPKTIKEIGQGAFSNLNISSEGIKGIVNLYYAGTEDEWNTVYKETGWSSATNINITYNYSPHD